LWVQKLTNHELIMSTFVPWFILLTHIIKQGNICTHWKFQEKTQESKIVDNCKIGWASVLIICRGIQMCVVLVVNALLEARGILCKVKISLLQVPFHSQELIKGISSTSIIHMLRTCSLMSFRK
jgi:hypothetical protein